MVLVAYCANCQEEFEVMQRGPRKSLGLYLRQHSVVMKRAPGAAPGLQLCPNGGQPVMIEAVRMVAN